MKNFIINYTEHGVATPDHKVEAELRRLYDIIKDGIGVIQFDTSNLIVLNAACAMARDEFDHEKISLMSEGVELPTEFKNGALRISNSDVSRKINDYNKEWLEKILFGHLEK